MTTINISAAGVEDQPQSAQSRVYALPLNTTSAINIQLFDPLQQNFQNAPNAPITPSASTYVGGTDRQSSSTEGVYSVVINTDDDTIKPSVYVNGSADEPVSYTKVPISSAPAVVEEAKPVIEEQQVDDNHSKTVVNVCADTQTDNGELYSRPVSKTSTAAVQYNGTESLQRKDDKNKTVVNVSAEVQTENGAESSSSASRNSSAVQFNGIESPVIVNSGGRDGRLSAGSETGSTRSSILDDTTSVTSSGSQGLSTSLNDGLASLNLTASNSEEVADQSRQRDFIYGRLPSQTDSVDSQQSGGSDSANTPTAATKPKKKEVKVTKKKIPLTWDDDGGSDNSTDIQVMDASAFILDQFTEEESKTVNEAEEMKGTRVALYKGQVLTAMLKVKCSSDEMGNDLRLLLLLRDILVRCDQLGQKMKGSAVRLTPFHLNKMRLDDGRPSKERAAEVARQLGGDMVLCEAVCQKQAERLHIATQIKDKVYEKGPFVVGKLGILVTLWKKHKYSVAAEFSGPLCDHICFYRPHLLGNTSETALKRKRKATDTVRHVFQSRDLLSQMFKTDPTITIAEAARRSFVDIIFYALYE